MTHREHTDMGEVTAEMEATASTIADFAKAAHHASHAAEEAPGVAARLRKLRSILAALAAAPALVGCAGDVPIAPGTATMTQGLYGLEGTFEYALDAPWRLDPIGWNDDSTPNYPAVPIQISFFDEYLWDADTWNTSATDPDKHLGDFCGLRIQVVRSDGTLTGPVDRGFAALADVERQGKDRNSYGTPNWRYPDDTMDGAIPKRTVCQPKAGTCSADDTVLAKRIHDSSEWNARFDYPLQRAAGTAVTLRLEAQVSKEVGKCAPPVTDPPTDAFSADNTNRIRFVNYVNVYYGRAPLPRFADDRWLYTDLHYHSQGTDNEGEVGYNYRGTLAAAGAIGIDAVFATDHASDSQQIGDADILTDWSLTTETLDGARDMTPHRWRQARDVWLEGAGGVNPMSSQIWPYARPIQPRVFLGGEVDVVPVVDQAPTTMHNVIDSQGRSVPVDNPDPAWFVSYGNGLEFDLFRMCQGWMFGWHSCPGDNQAPDGMFTPITRDDGTTGYEVHDVQGYNNTDYLGRQHVLYLPRSPSTPWGFVASVTSHYGGATRQLADGPGSVADDIRAKNGILFLAHPLDGGGGNVGPGMVPYTRTQLLEVFRHPAFAGLQLWNEDVRVKAGPGDNAGDWKETGYSHLSSSGNGDGHTQGWLAGEFDFVPVWDLERWEWRDVSADLDHNLHHGAYTWDEMLRWGLDRTMTEDLPFLPAGAPRKVFMAGGSDAHGDFNYRRTGYMVGPDGTNNDALGAVRNLVLAAPGAGAAVRQNDLVDALAAGRFAVTDGPAIRIAIDRNENGVYDDGDLQMGDTVYLDASQLAHLPLLVEWESTGDFGAVDRIDLYVGVDNDDRTVGDRSGRTYAPAGHGVRREQNELTQEQIDDGEVADPLAASCSSTGECRMQDGYWLPAWDARQKLRIDPDTYVNPDTGAGVNGMHDMVRVDLDLTQYHPSSGTGRRFYVRAFAITKPANSGCGGARDDDAHKRGRCIQRYAFTNPVWALTSNFRGVDCPYQPNSLDRDGDGYPDLCDSEPDVPSNGGWSRQAGGDNHDWATAIAHDATGAVIAGGVFMTSVTIDGAPTLTVAGSNDRDGYVVKYDATGRYQWIRQLTGVGYPTVEDIVTDAAGDVYVTGTFGGRLIIGATTADATGKDSYLVKLAGDTGEVVWRTVMTGTGDQAATALAIDSNGNLIVGGTFRTEVRFPSSVTLTGDTVADDCMVAWFGPSIGNILYARRVGGSGACKAYDVATGANGRVYLGGSFTGQLQPDPYYRPSLVRTGDGGTDAFVLALDGYYYAWDTYLGGGDLPGDAWVTALAVDAGGDLIVGGRFNNVLYSGTGTDIIGYADSQNDAMLIRYSSAGVHGAVKTLGGTGNEWVSDLDVAAGGIAVVGIFNTADMVAGPFTLSLGGSGDYASQGFALVVSPSDFQVQWAREFSFLGDAAIYSADYADDGKLAMAGMFDYEYKVDQMHLMFGRGVEDGFVANIQPLP
jgi:hypothetical protein